MKTIEIAEKIRDVFLDEVLDIVEFAGQVSVVVKRERMLEILRYLHDSEDLRLDHLQDLCGVDYKEQGNYRFEVVYQLFSIQLEHSIRIRARVPGHDPSIDSVTSIWEGASWHERECFDMFGILFKGHPDLRRILMPEDWEGHPLRKDYPLKGPKQYWQGFQEVLQRAQEYSKYETKGI